MVLRMQQQPSPRCLPERISFKFFCVATGVRLNNSENKRGTQGFAAMFGFAGCTLRAVKQHSATLSKATLTGLSVQYTFVWGPLCLAILLHWVGDQFISYSAWVLMWFIVCGLHCLWQRDANQSKSNQSTASNANQINATRTEAKHSNATQSPRSSTMVLNTNTWLVGEVARLRLLSLGARY